MPVHSLSPGGALSVERGEVVVAIPVFGALDLFEACLRSVVAHTGASVQVLVADDATPGGGVAELLREHAGEHRVAGARAGHQPEAERRDALGGEGVGRVDDRR